MEPRQCGPYRGVPRRQGDGGFRQSAGVFVVFASAVIFDFGNGRSADGFPACCGRLFFRRHRLREAVEFRQNGFGRLFEELELVRPEPGAAFVREPVADAADEADEPGRFGGRRSPSDSAFRAGRCRRRAGDEFAFDFPGGVDHAPGGQQLFFFVHSGPFGYEK